MLEEYDKKSFFTWCAKRGLKRADEIGGYFHLSPQTIRNWQRHAIEGSVGMQAVPHWVCLAIYYYNHSAGDSDEMPSAPNFEMTFSGLKLWQNKHGFSTYESTAEVFNVRRQAVHLWHKRQKIPAWVSLACLGYDCYVLDDNQEKKENIS